MPNQPISPAVSATPYLLSRKSFDAAIFDLDGVITQTARLHARAWKTMFDEFLAERGDEPFDIERDYHQYVDGKPRLDGIRSFLQSRRIDLARGDESDAAGAPTIEGLGKRKNALFVEYLERDGAEVFESSIALVRSLRSAGLRLAIVSSSRNCERILQSVGAQDLFDVKVDGNDARRLQLAGKPAPDYFVAAAKRLGVAPQRAVLFEDAISGVEAGRAGGFALVIGVDRAAQAQALHEHGAHLVVADLAQVAVDNAQPASAPLPSALARLDDIVARLRGRAAAVFLDYDGTLTPIVDRPEDAILDEPMRASVAHLAGLCTVAVVSGRDLADVRSRVALPELIYAGSHGFDIAGPNVQQALAEAEHALPQLDAAERELDLALNRIDGAQVERKRFSIAVHYRLVDTAQVNDVERAVDDAQRKHEGLRKRGGKKVFELQPDVEWDKGAAVNWLLDALDLGDDKVLPIYIGDDLTDEDAFLTLAGRGIGIVVLEEPRATAATYALNDCNEVRQFLDQLAAALERAE